MQPEKSLIGGGGGVGGSCCKCKKMIVLLWWPSTCATWAATFGRRSQAQPSPAKPRTVSWSGFYRIFCSSAEQVEEDEEEYCKCSTEELSEWRPLLPLDTWRPWRPWRPLATWDNETITAMKNGPIGSFPPPPEEKMQQQWPAALDDCGRSLPKNANSPPQSIHNIVNQFNK